MHLIAGLTSSRFLCTAPMDQPGTDPIAAIRLRKVERLGSFLHLILH